MGKLYSIVNSCAILARTYPTPASGGVTTKAIVRENRGPRHNQGHDPCEYRPAPTLDLAVFVKDLADSPRECKGVYNWVHTLTA